MAAALRSARSEEPVVILFSAELEATARAVASQLSKRCRNCLPIPSFAARRFATRQPSHHPLPAQRSPLFAPDAAREAIQKLAQYPGNSPIHDDAVILFTSGTTGGSKGVRLSHRAICVQALAKLLPPCRVSHRSVVLATSVPFFHVGGLSSIIATWMAGGCLAAPTESTSSSSSFDPAQVLQAVAADAVSTLIVVPAMLHALRQAANAPVVFPGVDLLLVGGQSASRQLLSWARTTFPRARLVQTYACTEAASSLTFLDVTREDDPSGELPHPLPREVSGDCVGSPPDHVQLALVPLGAKDDDEPQDEVPSGFIIDAPYTVGLIATQGPHLMCGYWGGGSPVRTHDWWVSGDLGFWDKRKRLWFCGRRSDSIRTGGETVLAAEVERILLQHPLVDECAVFGVPDDKFGQMVTCAFVSRHDVSLRELRHWCEKQGLASYKRPRRAFRVKEIPKNSSGKTLKYRLVEQFGASQMSPPLSRL